ncbi:MAG: MBL fold metallo-hydrolase [Parcubacteria group bacterium]|nr:MBL fold metallo-hydrolase [Parcubacteria group bacterium]
MNRTRAPSPRDISFTGYGAVREIGAALYVLNFLGYEVQLESGTRPRVSWAPETYKKALPHVLYKNIGALMGIRDIVITHAHLDHIGALALQFKLMLAANPSLTPDSLRIWMTGPAWRFTKHQLTQTVNSMKRNPDWKGHQPLFDEHDIDTLEEYVRIIHFGEMIELNPTLTMVVIPAGHILGAASFLFCQKLSNGGEARVLATGDTSDKDQIFIRGAVRPDIKIDMLIPDGTNLGKIPDPLETPVEGFLESDSFLGTLNRGGIVVVPSLSIHREPDNIARIRNAGLEKVAKLYIDGGDRALQIFKECLEPEQQHLLENLTFIHGKREREEVLRSRHAIVVAAGGMFPDRSPAHWWLTRGVEHADVSFVINNWQDPCSPGTALLAHRHGAAEEVSIGASSDPCTIEIGHDTYEVRCEVHRLATSSHQEEGEFERMVDMLSPKRIVVVHAEFSQATRYLTGKDSERFAYPKHGTEVGI